MWVSALVGATIEWYDFFLYGVVAGIVFNKLYFPGSDPVVSALLAYTTFVRSNRVLLSRLDAYAHDLVAFLTTGAQVAVSDGKVRALGRNAANRGAQ